MDFIELKKRYKQDRDYPQRTFDLDMYRRVLEDTIYDAIPNPFFKSASAGTGDPILLSKRRPSVHCCLAKVVVDNSVSLLFGEGRFPQIVCEDDDTKETLNDLAKERNLNLTMIDCATKGSIGSAVLFLNVINGKLFFNACYSIYFTPTFDPEDPEQLSMLQEKLKKTGAELEEMGYEGLEEKKIYWFMRTWDATSETYYIPWQVSGDKEKKITPQIDRERTVVHNLGFVPAIWIKNLPGSDTIDGLCTFKLGINTNIELDYQMSQGGRGLKYSSEPLLVIKNMAMQSGEQKELGPGDILSLDENGDAKFAEISGDACKAVLEYCKTLRDIILENTHGNRSTPEKNHTVQSGRAMEMMHMTLIWLADRLRITYGECGLRKLMLMIIKVSEQMDLSVGDNNIKRGSLKKEKLSINWPAFFPPTNTDLLQEATTITTLKDKGIISTETAVSNIAEEYNIVDVNAEIAVIKNEQQEMFDMQNPTVTETIQE